MPKVGECIAVWWGSGGRVLEVLPYTGRYPQWFTCVLRLSAPTTKSGYVDMAWGPGS